MNFRIVLTIMLLFNCTINSIYSQSVGIGSSSFTPGAMLEIRGSGATGGTSALIVTNSTPTTLLTILNNGNVGIGTSSPGRLLQVLGSSNSAVQFVVNSANGTAGEETIGLKNLNNTNSNTTGIMARNSADALIGWIDFINVNHNAAGTQSGAMSFSTINAGSYSQRMYIKEDGNIGIGTTTPVTKVQVDLSSANTYASVTGADIGLFIKNTNSTANNVDILSFGDANGFGIAQVGATITDHTNHSGKLFFATKASGSSIAQRVTIDENGNVGIGTTSPTYKLHLYNGDAQIYNTTPILSLSESANGGNEYRATVNNNVLSLGRWNNQNSLNINGSGYVGIGTSPSYYLQLNYSMTGTTPGSHTPPVAIRNTSTTSGVLNCIGFFGSTSAGASYPTGLIGTVNTPGAGIASGDIIFVPVNTGGSFFESMRLASSGNVGIGTNNPTALLHVNGSAGNGTGVWSNLSDERLKKNIKPLKDGLSIILRLQGVEFNWKDSLKDKQYGRVKGFIAQDVKKVIPEWVKTQNDGYNYLETIGFNAVIVEAIKEQQVIIEKQNAQILQLQMEFDTFKKDRNKSSTSEATSQAGK